MQFEYLVSALVTLLVVVDPVGLVPSFLAVTGSMPSKSRRRVAVRACIIAGAILAGTALVGDWLLAKLGITLPASATGGCPAAEREVIEVRSDRNASEPSCKPDEP